jgi:ppGpp synthetase/RelA/SpoT-type nucleotidyltranferase
MARPPSTRTAATFLAWYKDVAAGLEVAARQLETYLAQALKDNNVFLHAVTARAKSVESVAAKLLLKSYTNPKSQMTDQIGVRG